MMDEIKIKKSMIDAIVDLLYEADLATVEAIRDFVSEII